jgi:hypothetical protein
MSVDINDPEFNIKLINCVKEYGIVIIKNVMTCNEADQYTERTISSIEKISDFKRNDLKTWTNKNLPPQVRPGMFHEIVCNIPSINDIRFNKNIIKIFKTYYSFFKDIEYQDIDLIVSNDGLNIKPGLVPPYSDIDKDSDWAHVDQTEEPDNLFKCIQGQMVLSNTSACFRASPKSHLLFKEFLAQPNNPYTKTNFLKFKQEQYSPMKKRLEEKEIGGMWQIKIPAKKGDFIIWTSSTVHSALMQDRPERPLITDKWNGWRHVVYVCYRPRDEFTEKELKTKYDGFLDNRVTNHWGTMIFPKGSTMRNNKEDYTEKIKNLCNNPELVYKIRGLEHNLTKEQSIMMGASAQ